MEWNVEIRMRVAVRVTYNLTVDEGTVAHFVEILDYIFDFVD